VVKQKGCFFIISVHFFGEKKLIENFTISAHFAKSERDCHPLSGSLANGNWHNQEENKGLNGSIRPFEVEITLFGDHIPIQ
jgi:hypothetical protein